MDMPRIIIGRAAHRAFATMMAAAMTLSCAVLPPSVSAKDQASRERGDVPGWVMITMMTAIP